MNLFIYSYFKESFEVKLLLWGLIPGPYWFIKYTLRRGEYEVLVALSLPLNKE